MATYLPPDIEQEQADIARQRAYAKLLQDQGMSAPQGQMVGDRYVAPHATQYLAQLLNSYVGGKKMEQADARSKALAEQLSGRRQSWLDSMPKNTPERQVDLQGPTPDGAQLTGTVPGQQANSADYLNWATKGLTVDPQLAQAGFNMADRIENREAQAEARKAAVEQRMAELKQRSEDARASQAERIAAQQEAARLQREFMLQMAEDQRRHSLDLARITAANRQEPAPTLTTIQDPKDPTRSVVVDARTGRQIGTAPPKDGKPSDAASKVNDAKEAIALINDAEKLIDGATGSYGGVAVDALAQTFGRSTEGAQKAAQLKAIEGMLVSKMPKMSGPQSDKDVALYRQMAASIGDPTIPTAQKRAALKTVKEIQQRYAGEGGATGSWSAPTPQGGKNIVVDF